MKNRISGLEDTVLEDIYVKVLTASGSAYILDQKKMTWKRERLIPDGPSPNPMRTQEGTLEKWPELKRGESMVLICPSIVKGFVGRAIISSPVAEVMYLPKPDVQDCCREIYKILLSKEKILYTELARRLTTMHNHTCLRELTRWCLKKGLPPITVFVVAPVDTNDPITKRCEQLDAIWYGRKNEIST